MKLVKIKTKLVPKNKKKDWRSSSLGSITFILMSTRGSPWRNNGARLWTKEMILEVINLCKHTLLSEGNISRVSVKIKEEMKLVICQEHWRPLVELCSTNLYIISTIVHVGVSIYYLLKRILPGGSSLVLGISSSIMVKPHLSSSYRDPKGNPLFCYESVEGCWEIELLGEGYVGCCLLEDPRV